MQRIDLGRAFLNRDPIPGVTFMHNDYVRIVAGPHTGQSGSLVTVLALTPEPRFVLELESGFDVEVRQSEIRGADRQPVFGTDARTFRALRTLTSRSPVNVDTRTHMGTAADLDAALIASIGPHWTKVAMVLQRAAKTPGLAFGEEEDEYALLAERLEQLVAAGRVLAQGNVKQWRFSEVRLAST